MMESSLRLYKSVYPERTQLQEKLFRDRLDIWQKWLEQTHSSGWNALNQAGKSQILLRKSLKFFFSFRWYLDSPWILPDIREAVAAIRNSWDNDKTDRIVIYGDRDADGLTSSSILFLFLKEVMGYPADRIFISVPGENDRYGFNEPVAQRLAELKPDLLIMFDHGSSNALEIKNFQTTNPSKTKILIFDHHFLPQDEKDYPEITAFVNPKRLNWDNPERDLCSAGLAFKLIHALIYSYTSEFDKQYLLTDSNISIQNGNTVEAGAENIFESHFGAGSGYDLSPGWEACVKQDGSLLKFVKCHEEAGLNISDSDKVRILQNISLSKVWNKISPFLTYTAIGTVADMMPLYGDNRIFVREGLRLLNQRVSIPGGLWAMLSAAGLQPSNLVEQDISFSIAPLINAAGRLGKAKLAAEMLTENDPLIAAELADNLRKLNDERKNLSREAFELLEKEISVDENTSILFFYDPRVHRGISGLVAGT